jgi:hypothetical protein
MHLFALVEGKGVVSVLFLKRNWAWAHAPKNNLSWWSRLNSERKAVLKGFVNQNRWFLGLVMFIFLFKKIYFFVLN